jgi:hypothetical protein
MYNRSLLSNAIAIFSLAFSSVVGAQALYVTPAGDVGVGTDTPDSSFEVRRSDGTAAIRVDERSTTIGSRNLFTIRNKGLTRFVIDNTAGEEWAFVNKGTSFRITRPFSGVYEFEIFNNGDATLHGALTENSDVNSKQDIELVDGSNILEKLSNLEISEWSYKDAPKTRHIGPMAQDFYATFGLGHTEKGIATLDSSGVALAAIKALIEENSSLKERLSVLENQQAEMQAVVIKVLENQQEQRILTNTVLN